MKRHKNDRKVELICSVCGIIFRVSPSLAIGRKCCSKKCGYRYLSINYSGENSKAGWRGARVELTCGTCKNKFYEFRSRVNEGRGKYCSRKCFEESMKETLLGDKNRNWLGGRTRQNDLFKGMSWWRDLRMVIYKRDNFTCQMCGIKCSSTSGPKKIQCDHIIPRVIGGGHDEENLWTLCNSCHGKKDSFIRTKNINKLYLGGTHE